MRTLKLKNVLYFPSLNVIGGVETFCYEFGLKFGNAYDVTLIYRGGDPAMIKHIAETCRVIRYREGDEIECDVFIFGWGYDILPRVRAKEYIQTFHADYINRQLNPCPDPRVTRRFGVAENTTAGIREHFDWAADIVTMYNPYTVKKPRKVLRLVSATRLTREKGFDRMEVLAGALDAADVPYHWMVFTDSDRTFKSPNVTTMPPRLDVLPFIADADYLVQLSDTEGYSYSIVEALSVGTPVIVTDIPVAEEQGVVDGKTGFILPMDMSTIPIDAIVRGLKKFKVEPRESHYETVLAEGAAEYEPDEAVTVSARQRYRDLRLGRIVEPGEMFETDRGRADELMALGLVVTA